MGAQEGRAYVSTGGRPAGGVGPRLHGGGGWKRTGMTASPLPSDESKQQAQEDHGRPNCEEDVGGGRHAAPRCPDAGE